MKSLTDREKNVLALVAKGKKRKEIAEQLKVSIHTVNSTILNISNKLGFGGAVNLTNYARDNNITT